MIPALQTPLPRKRLNLLRDIIAVLRKVSRQYGKLASNQGADTKEYQGGAYHGGDHRWNAANPPAAKRYYKWSKGETQQKSEGEGHEHLARKIKGRDDDHSDCQCFHTTSLFELYLGGCAPVGPAWSGVVLDLVPRGHWPLYIRPPVFGLIAVNMSRGGVSDRKLLRLRHVQLVANVLRAARSGCQCFHKSELMNFLRLSYPASTPP